jgi:hypothetical protein
MADFTPDDFNSTHDEHGGDLPKINDQGRKSIPGLGCPHCPAGFYSTESRAAHIKTLHPGEYSGPTADMETLARVHPELAYKLGVSLEEEHYGLGSPVPDDARALFNPSSGNHHNTTRRDLLGLKSHLNQVHSQILQNGVDDHDTLRLARHVNGAHQNIDSALASAEAGDSTMHNYHMSVAHEHIDDIADISENWYNEPNVHEDLQDHISKLY